MKFVLLQSQDVDLSNSTYLIKIGLKMIEIQTNFCNLREYSDCQGTALSFLFWASYFGYTMHNNILMMLDLVAVTEY